MHMNNDTSPHFHAVIGKRAGGHPPERQTKQRALSIWMLLAVLVLAACGVVPGATAGEGVATAVPTATLDPAGFRAIDTRACLIADWTTMQANRPAGDLIAWQPGSRNIAYLDPSERSSWFIGDLMLAKAPDYTVHEELAPGVLVNGDLTWSPSGEKLAFLAFRPNENLYTVMTVRADGTGLTDLFPTDLARTDARTSQKAVIGWRDDDTVQVMASCGEECRNAYEIDASGPTGPVLTPTPIGDYTELNKNLAINRKVVEYDEEDFPRLFQREEIERTRPHWSPDNRWVAYLDKRLLLWVLSPEEKVTFTIDIGLRDVSETQWALDSKALAVRAEDRIFVFDLPCSK